MASSTANKKETVDFLWQWAENRGNWSKLLVNEIVRKEESLTITELERIFDYFLQDIGLVSGLPQIDIKKPVYTPTNSVIELLSIADVKGVNKLAENQTINFGKNLTVIYGENGTGKSSYGRVLKALGFSYDTNDTIYHNIFNKPETKSATITFKVDDVENTFIWNGSNKNNDLSNISVFNTQCVQISLSDRKLIVSPVGFHLFNLVSAHLDRLKNLLEEKINSYKTSITWSENLNVNTPQGEYIRGLSSSSSEEKLMGLASFKDDYENVLKIKRIELTGLNKDLLQTTKSNLLLQIKELEVIISEITKASLVFSIANFQQLKKYEDKLAELENKKQKGLKEIAESRGIEFYSSIEFQSFIEHAEQYIKKIGKIEYPSDEDICVYCQQPLEVSAKELLGSYRAMLNDTTQREIRQINNLKKSIINKFRQINRKLEFSYTTFGLDEHQNPKQPDIIVQYNKLISSILSSISPDETIIKEFPPNIDFEKHIKFFNKKKEVLKESFEAKKENLDNIVQKEEMLRRVINEFEDRKLLSKKIDGVKTCIKNKKIVKLLRDKLPNFNTRTISLQTSQAREELIRQDFTEYFENELRSLRKSNIRIDLNFTTAKGSSRVTQKVNSSYVLTDILSEGEQKAIALAEFLTELQLDNKNAPIIFDDPVNSLDHKIISEVARRMIKLSKDRQVIIFTHSVLLFNDFLYSYKQPPNKGMHVKFYNLRNEFGETGVVSEAVEEINSVKVYVKKINVLINEKLQGRSESDIASEGYGYLRSAIELFVEHEIFQGTVKRYQKNVAFTLFMKVNGAKLDVHKEKLNEVFERCCSFIKGHSHPMEIHNTPTIDGLKADFDDFKSIRNEFK